VEAYMQTDSEYYLDQSEPYVITITYGLWIIGMTC
jgi:hypothetical protein